MDRTKALALLRQMLGPNAEFRAGQWEAIDHIVNHGRRLLVVQRTGWGKSVVYFLATKILRTADSGPTLLISPLLSPMRNQQLATGKLGLRADAIHSENVEKWSAVEEALANDSIDLLMVAPERLANPAFMRKLSLLLQGRVGLFVVDEAHCISDWGHDFRPDYRRILQIMKLLRRGVPVLCTTATANNRVVRDIETQIPQLQVLRGPLVRSSLRLYNVRLARQSDRLAWLAHFLPKLPGSGIVYCLTVQDARRVAAWLQANNLSARAYHADLEGVERVEIETQLLDNKVKALVATVALGMGFDKPDLGFVVHFQRPGSVVAYYQQVGRAGRAVDSAFGILLSGSEDDEISDYFIRTAFPPVGVMQAVLAAMEKRGPLTMDDLQAELNQGYGAIEKALKLLEVDGAVTHDKHGYSRSSNPWRPDVMRFRQVTQLRRDELEQMRRYVEHKGCLMEFLARALDDPNAGPCGKCMNCTKHAERRPVPASLTQAAVNFLRGDALVLEPRLRWPKPLLEEIRSASPEAVESGDKGVLKTIIPEMLRAEAGRVLCVWGDSGWGDEVAQGKYEAGRFSDALVDAAVALVREKWKPSPAPAWVTAVPSARRAKLIDDFAHRFAAKLNLPFTPILVRARHIRPQKQMQNSIQQVRNLLGAFSIEGMPPPGAVLLVDDVVDSGWTLALSAVLLRQRGSGPVYPLALAKASPRGG
jgi:ATP-dependent DNA helicase RecQ